MIRILSLFRRAPKAGPLTLDKQKRAASIEVIRFRINRSAQLRRRSPERQARFAKTMEGLPR